MKKPRPSRSSFTLALHGPSTSRKLDYPTYTPHNGPCQGCFRGSGAIRQRDARKLVFVNKTKIVAIEAAEPADF